MFIEPLQTENLSSVLHHWRADALEFLRVDVPKIIVIIIIAFALIRLMKVVINRLQAFSRHESGARAQQLRTAAGVIGSVGTFVIIFLALMQILPVLGVNMGPLLASAGVAGLAIGFGAQTLVHDVINGFFILLENQYAVGDVVRVAGVKGTVEAMTMRNTTLRDDDGTVHVVPNSEIKIVSNLTRDWAQLALHISVAYNEESDRVVKLLQQVSDEVRNDPSFRDDIVAEPQVPGIERVAGGEVDYLLLVKTRPGRQYGVSRELRRRIKECFQKNNIQAGNPARVYVLEGVPGSSGPQSS
ncbi:MAG TPA: mechanosensitive ion channel family protein [Terriglobales bacterium]|nr:mechanosensitive ion channel family protein [Terriglobales bacterium]